MQPTRIAIYGLSKTGSTGLFFKIKNSLRDDCFCLFEPADQVNPLDLSDIKRTILVKKIFLNSNFVDQYREFDKRIILVRDPRDRIVSQLLYRCGYHVLPEKNEGKIVNSLLLLKEKEIAPKAISFLDISKKLFFENETQVINRIKGQLDAIISFKERNDDCFIVKYENFISNRMSFLEKYLEFPLMGTANVDSEFHRVERTKGSGSWRDWFLEEDIKILKPLMERYFYEFGYDFTDWELNNHKQLNPEHCSEYVKRILNERLENFGLNAIR